MKKVLMPMAIKSIGEMVVVAGLVSFVFFNSSSKEIPEEDEIQQATENNIIQEEIKVEKKPVYYLTDEDLSKLYTLKIDVNTDTCLNTTVEEDDMLMRIGVCEDYTSVESQANVMLVVWNRVKSPLFPNSIQEVIEQKGQFSTVSSGLYQKAVPNVDSHLALALVQSGQMTSEALYFEAAWAKDTWQSKHCTYLFTSGGTKYYK